MIRLLALALCILFATQISTTQKLKKKSATKGLRKEVYYIDKETKFKNGLSYTVRTDTKDTLSLGRYNDSRRVGEWRFTDGEKGEDYIIYNYDTDSLVYFNNELFADTFLIMTENGLEVKSVDRPAIYTGSRDDVAMAITDNAFDMDLVKKGKEGLTVVNYLIDTLGNLSSAKVIQSIDKNMPQQIDRSIRSLPGKFLPAIIDGKPVESGIFIRVNLAESDYRFQKPDKLSRSSYIYDIGLMYFKETTVRKVERRVPAGDW